MKTFAAVLLLSAPLLAQDNLPSTVGTGNFPPKVDVSTDIRELRDLEIETFASGVEVLRDRYRRGLLSIAVPLDALARLTDARLQKASSQSERVAIIQDSFTQALTTWQRVNDLLEVGARGGGMDEEAQARAAAFRYRAMWLQELTESAGQGKPGADSEAFRLPEDLRAGDLPPGLDSSDLNTIRDLHIKALESSLEVIKTRYQRGLPPLAVYINTVEALNTARLQIATTKQARLDVIQDSLVNALIVWQRVNELNKVGARGGGLADEGLSRAATFRYRAMWLEEKIATTNAAGNANQQTADNDGIPDQVGTGEYPPGLLTANDVESARKLQLEALELSLAATKALYDRGLIHMTVVVKSQEDLAIARLEWTREPQERLAVIEDAFVSALRGWQRFSQLKKVMARGGEADVEAISLPMVYHYRVMWLMEKQAQTNRQQQVNQTAAAQEIAPAADVEPCNGYCRPKRAPTTICMIDRCSNPTFRLRAFQPHSRPFQIRRWSNRFGR